MTARSFNGTSDLALRASNVIDVANTPFGAVCRFRQNATGASRGLFGWSDSANSSRYVIAFLNAGGAVSFQWVDNAATSASFSSTTSAAANTWNLAGVASLGTSERYSWLNGAGRNTNTTTVGATTTNQFFVGCRRLGTTPSLFFNGLIANVAVWDLTNWGANAAARLAAFEQAQAEMAKGVPPSAYPIGRVDLWRLRGNLSPENGRFPLTLTGTSKATQGPPVARRYNGRTAA